MASAPPVLIMVTVLPLFNVTKHQHTLIHNSRMMHVLRQWDVHSTVKGQCSPSRSKAVRADSCCVLHQVDDAQCLPHYATCAALYYVSCVATSVHRQAQQRAERRRRRRPGLIARSPGLPFASLVHRGSAPLL